MRKGLKAALIGAVCVLTAAAIVVGVVWYIGRDTTPVNVYSVGDFSISGGNVDMNYYYGPVRADNLQSVVLSDTQLLTEVLVEEGQTVKKGDALLRYDTTLSDIRLERQEIAVKQAQLALENAQKELREINNMKPYTPPPATEAPTQTPTEPLEPVEELPYLYGGKGTQESPYRILWSEELTYDETYLRGLMGEESDVWLAFEVREEHAVKGELRNRFGLHVMLPAAQEEEAAQRLYYSFFVPTDAPETEEPQPEAPDLWVDDSSGYTAAEIARMRTEKQREIRDCDLNYRMAQVELERMKSELNDGTVYAKLDGTITHLATEEEARAEGGTLLVLSGGGRYYIDLSVDEFTCRTLTPGTPVTAQTWWPETAAYEGQIEEVTTTLADQNGYTGTGNPNVTYYKVVVSIPGDAVIQEGNYVDVQIGSTAGESDSLYLENFFLRYDGARAYVYRRGADGLLEKRYVRTGTSLWGAYTEILDGLSADDRLAFPYGKTVKSGAQTAERTADVLYNSY